MDFTELARLQSSLRILQNMNLPSQLAMQIAHSAQAMADLYKTPALEALQSIDMSMCNSARAVAAVNKNYEYLNKIASASNKALAAITAVYNSPIFSSAAYRQLHSMYDIEPGIKAMINFSKTNQEFFKTFNNQNIWKIAHSFNSKIPRNFATNFHINQQAYSSLIEPQRFKTITSAINQYYSAPSMVLNIPAEKSTTYIESALESLDSFTQHERNYILDNAENKPKNILANFDFTPKMQHLIYALIPALLLKNIDLETVKNILENVAFIASIYMFYKTHNDSVRAHQDAVQAHQDALQAKTDSEIIQKQNNEIINLLKENLEISKELSSKQLPTSQVHHEKINDNNK